MNDIMKKRIVRASLVALLVSMPACVTPALAAGTVLAGISNTATALNSAVSGGQGNSASGDYAAIAGGHKDTASGKYSFAGGGYNNTASGNWATAIGGQGGIVAGECATGIAGGSATAEASNSFAIGFGSVAKGAYGAAIGRNAVATEAQTVSFGDATKGADTYNRLVNIHDGLNAHDAAAVGQTTRDVTSSDQSLKVTKSVNEDGSKSFDLSVNANGAVADGDMRAVSGSTVYQSMLTRTDGNTITIDKNGSAQAIDVSGKDGQTRTLTGIASNPSDSTSAANVGYVNNRFDSLNTKLTDDMYRIGAGAAALAALHPLDYDPENTLEFAVGYGHYHDKNAAALGAFYHPNGDVMFNVGGTIGNGEAMVNAGATFRIGSGASHTRLSRSELEQKVANQDERIRELEEKLREIESAMAK